MSMETLSFAESLSSAISSTFEMTTYTSILSYRDLLSDIERHDNQRRRVYAAVRDWLGQQGPSREDIACVTKLRLSSVCGRVRELLDDGILIKGPMKSQEVVPGKPLDVETLDAVVYRHAEPRHELQLQLL